MSEFAKSKGSVFFIDILGFSALTQNKINLKRKDYAPWDSGVDHIEDNQTLAAVIIKTFREIISEVKQFFPELKAAQFSDCSYIWCESIYTILRASNKIMALAIEKGVFCRGGIAYGEIIESIGNNELGKVILGEAVSKAAKLEGISKGARIFIDVELPMQLWEENEEYGNKLVPLFKSVVNPLDFQTYDEYKWFLAPNFSDEIQDLRSASPDVRIELTKQRLKLANFVRLSPKFSWNSKTADGLTHLKATINFISQNKLLSIYHSFGWEDPVEKRSVQTVNRINEKIDIGTYLDFKRLEDHLELIKANFNDSLE